MKKQYDPNARFLVTYAINKRKESWESFKLSHIETEEFGLHDTITKAPNNKLSDGEIANALLNLLNNLYSDDTYSYSIVSIINWWEI